MTSTSTSSTTSTKTPSTPLLMMESAVSSSGALLFSNPFELIKTRLQLQGELQAADKVTVVYKNMLHGVYVVGRNEGITALYQGIAAAIVHQVVMNGIRFGLYDPFKNNFSKLIRGNKNENNNDLMKLDSGSPYFYSQLLQLLPEDDPLFDVPANLCAAFSVGIVGAFFGSPFFLMKTRLQAKNSSNQQNKVGKQHQYRGMIDGLTQIYKNEGGVRGWWNGAISCMVRTGIGSAAQLPMYDYIKSVGVRYYGFDSHDIKLHMFCALCACNNIVLFMCPVDTLNVRMFNASKTCQQQYSSNIFVALGQIAKIEGVRGLYKGAGALWWRTMPHSMGTFLILEQVRKHRSQTSERFLPFLYSEKK